MTPRHTPTVPETDTEPHVDVDLDGIHLAFDTRETILSFNTRPWHAFWGMPYAIVHDPDGNPVDLFAPLV
jgi:hypothetical protein